MLALLGTAMQITADYREGQQQISERLARVAASTASSLAEALWEFDRRQIEAQLEGILADPDIVFAEVRETGDPEGGLVVTRGRAPLADDIRLGGPLTRTQSKHSETLGTLDIAASIQGLHSRLTRRARLILASQTIQVFVVALCILWIVDAMVMRHLRSISSHMRSVSLPQLPASLSLTRKHRPGARSDELDQMVGAFNDMRDNLGRHLEERDAAEKALLSSRETFATVLDSIDADVYVSDLETHEILFVNRKIKEGFGEDLMGRNCWEAFRHGTGPCEHCTNAVLVADDGSPTGLTVWEGYNPVTHRWYMNYDRAVEWLDGRLVRMHIATDITEQRRIEEELKRVEKLESLGVLAGGIAHDINNLLMGIMGNLSLARLHANLSTRTAELLEEAEKASARATSLTHQLLTFAKGGAPVRKSESIKKIIETSTSFALRGSNVAIELGLPEDLWPVDVDEGQIGHVFHNLVLNAGHAMPNGGRLKIVASNQDLATGALPAREGGRYVEITVRDEGVGISPESVSKVFDPYFTTKQRGSGLGLAAAHSIIQKHHGHITVESRLGIGTTFRLYLPASTTAATEVAEGANSIASGGDRVLVMDDEAALREVLASMLEATGYECATAADGAEAVTMYRDSLESGRRFDAVILDLTVPGGMGGRETVQELLELDPMVLAIVSSGYSTDPVMSSFREYGYCGVVAKPYRVTDLAAVLEHALANRSEPEETPIQ